MAPKKDDGLKQAAQFGFDFVNDFTKIFGLVRKIDLIHRNDKQFALLVIFNPSFVPFVQAFEVVQADVVFEIATPLLDLTNQGGNRGT
jgi:hypothetical protein